MDDIEDLKQYLSSDRFDPDSTCRSCLAYGDSVQSVFEMDDWAERLRICTDTEVRMEDGLPRGLCPDCIADLIGAYHFRSRCRRSDDLLKSLTGPEREPPQEVAYYSDDDGPVVMEYDKKGTECDLCPRKFSTNRGLVMHQSQAHNRKPDGTFQCGECMYNTNRERDLKNHILKHTEGMPYGCKACGKVYKTARSLYIHRKLHQNLLCSICERIFRTADLLEAHQASPDAHPLYKCDRCPYETRHPRGYRRHLVRHVPSKSAPAKSPAGHVSWRCRTCYERFPTEELLLAHKATRRIHRKIKCAHCSFYSYCKKSFENHSLKHQFM